MNHNMENILETILYSGTIGAGGAGFPTHFKYKNPLEQLVLNGAECEPLLYKDKEIMRLYAREIVEAIEVFIDAGLIKKAVICVKKKAKKAVASLEKAVENKENIRIYQLDNFYPSGDEIVQICEVTGVSVPYGKLPSHNGIVVNNVETFLNIFNALKGIPVTEKFITICGEVEKPVTLKVPLGVKLSDCLEYAGKILAEDPVYLKNGIMMSSFGENFDDIITKTTAGYVILNRDHYLVSKKTQTPEKFLKIGKSACDQCSYCTEFCPRYLVGHKVQPHKVMRSLIFSPKQMIGMSKWASACVECGLCGLFACPEDLSPHLIMGHVKAMLRKENEMFEGDETSKVHPMREYRKLSVTKLTKRLNISQYDVSAPMADSSVNPDYYYFPLGQHIGAPSIACVTQGERVSRGQMIGKPANGLSASTISSVDGIVEEVNDLLIKVRRQ